MSMPPPVVVVVVAPVVEGTFFMRYTPTAVLSTFPRGTSVVASPHTYRLTSTPVPPATKRPR